MRNFQLHPTHQLLIWCFFVLLLSWPPLSLLSWIVASNILIASTLIPLRILKTSLWRLRWLLVATGVIFAWGTPGVYWFNSKYAPTIEGVYLGFEQGLRLIGIVSSLQIVLWRLDEKGLLSACYYLLYPLKWCGVDITSFAIRLGLTLQYTNSENIYPINLKWKELLSHLQWIEQNQGETMHEIEIILFTVFDRWICVGLLLLGFAAIVAVNLLPL